MTVPNRNYSSPSYRYGFQGQEKDDEVKGNGNSINYKFRMHDPRVGRFFAVDPLTAQYPNYTPYSFSGNKVIAYRELEGMEEIIAIIETDTGLPVIKRLDGTSIILKSTSENLDNLGVKTLDNKKYGLDILTTMLIQNRMNVASEILVKKTTSTLLKSAGKAFAKMNVVFDMAAMARDGELNPGGLFPFAFVADSLIGDLNEAEREILLEEVGIEINKGAENTESYIDKYDFKHGLTENFEFISVSNKTLGNLLIGNIKDFEDFEDTIFEESDEISKPNSILFEFSGNNVLIHVIFIDDEQK
jgi:RHS repeat-associated protein